MSTEGDDQPTTMWAELCLRGWTPPRPDLISDAALSAALHRVVMDLSWLHVYLIHAEHLTDRDLYERLVAILRHDHIPIHPDDPDAAIVISFIREGSDEELQTYLRYYAEPRERAYWAEHAPNLAIPATEPPPYPRVWFPVRPTA